MSGRDQVESLDEELGLEEVKDGALVEEARAQIFGSDKQQDDAERRGMNVGSEGAMLISADQNDNYLSGIADSEEILYDKSCGESFEEKDLSSRAHIILAEDANAFEGTRKALEDVDAGGNVVDAVSTKENGSDFVDVVSSLDVDCTASELTCNQLLPTNDAKGSNSIQNEICKADASGSPVDSGRFASFSGEDGKEVMASDDRTFGENENMHQNRKDKENDIGQDKEDHVGVTMRREEFWTTRETQEEDSERIDRKEEIECLVETIESDFESGAVENFEFGETKDSYGETSIREKKIDLIEDDVFRKNAYSAKFQADISCNEIEEHDISDSVDKLSSFSSGKVVGGSCNDGLGEVEEVHQELNDFHAESDRGNKTSSPKDISPNINANSTIGSDIENFDSKIRGNFDEEESEYHSVTSHRYSSFESLNDEEAQRNNSEDWILGNIIEKEAVARGILGSETDRTDDDYVTCDEAGSFVNEPLEGCDGDIDDYKGYETQEYLTADKQSEFGEEPLGIGGMKEEECAKGSDAAKEDDDDRGTIVGSDVEQEESKENARESDVNRICTTEHSDILNKVKEGSTESENNAEEKSYDYEKTDDEEHEKV